MGSGVSVKPTPDRSENAPGAALRRLATELAADPRWIPEVSRDVAEAVHDALPAANTSLLLGAALFLAAYCVRPVPCIVLPGRGAFGIPAKRKRKH